MNSSSLIKVVAAFVTGILVALVGALAYVKIADRSPSEPVVKSSPTLVQAAAEQASPEQAAPEAAEPQILAGNDRPAKLVRHDTLSPVGHKFNHRTAGDPSARLSPPQLKLNEPESSKAPANPYLGGETNPNSNHQPPVSAQPAGPQPEPVVASSSTPVQAQVQPPVRQPQSVTLEPGMSFVIRVNEALSTEHNYTGDTFRGTLEQPVIINGFIIADKGSKVLGRIVNAEKPGRVRGVADLSLALSEINTTDGQRVDIQTSSVDKRGGSNTGRNAEKVAGGAAIGAIIGAIAGGGMGAGIGAGVGGAAGAGDVLLTHGKAATVANETVLTFRLSAPVTVTERLN